MKLSDGEKLIIMMLTEVYEALGIDGNRRGELDPTFIAEAVRSGCTWGLRWQYPGVFESGDQDEEEIQETLDILDMWWMIEVAFERFSEEDKARVTAEIAPFKPQFQGFDGNNEAKELNTASFLIDKMGRFEKFKGRYLNSHGPTLDAARRMLSVYKPARSAFSEGLSPDDVIAIIKGQSGR